jgi:hypothetical protein
MKKIFQLSVEGKNYDRLVEAAKHEIRQYIKREKRKTVPSGKDFWDFECKIGSNNDDAQVIKFSQITSSIDLIVAARGAQFYIEIIAKAVTKEEYKGLAHSEEI